MTAIIGIVLVVVLGLTAHRKYSAFANRDLMGLSDSELFDKLHAENLAGNFDNRYAREMYRRCARKAK